MMPRLPLLTIPCLLLLGPAALAAEQARPLAFNRDVRPILSDNCFACHGPDRSKRKARLRLDTPEGGQRVVVPGSPRKSELIRRITATGRTHMPPRKSGRQLTAKQVEVLTRWVEQGAQWEPHWAYVAPKRPDVPEVKDSAWVRNPVDRFILARLEAEGLRPSPEAARTTLIRRVTLDLTGVPPTPEEVDAFLNDRSPDAYERVVDRLLASPRYGERMALDWLDVARYADSNGYQQDLTRTLWPWRDWVIAAFNANMPFDQFTVEQIAGDLLPNATTRQKIATGFNRNHMLNGEGGRIPEESRVDYVVDRVDTTATVWLGLTLGCARCHDHKFDPFTQKDYYSLFAYFNNVAETGAVDRGGNANPVLRLITPQQTRQIEQAQKRVRELERELKGVFSRPRPTPADAHRAAVGALLRTPGPLAALTSPAWTAADSARGKDMRRRLAKANGELSKLNRSVLEVMVMQERPTPRPTHVLIRGAYDKYGEKVSPGVPQKLAPLPKGAPANRLGLARWLVSPANPLTARVAVNRAWQMLFGTGLVKTAEDFGVQGEPPSHPELLDWLATEFVRGGWDVKALHRLLVTSATYRQSSKLTPLLRERDAENRLLARGPRFRLSSHAIRDQALALSGLLVERLGGPPVRPYQPPGIWEEMSFGYIHYVQDHGPNLYRRSLYTFWRRTVGPPNLFDTPARQVCVVRPTRTNTPLQALVTLNDVTYAEAARVLAQRVMTRGGTTPEQRVDYTFRLATARHPTPRETSVLLNAYRRLLGQYQADRAAARKLVSAGEAPRDPNLDVSELAAYTGLATLVLNLDEALTKE
jgi:hypothetical protein